MLRRRAGRRWTGRGCTHLDLTQREEGRVLLHGLADQARRLRFSLRLDDGALLLLRGLLHLQGNRVTSLAEPPFQLLPTVPVPPPPPTHTSPPPPPHARSPALPPIFCACTVQPAPRAGAYYELGPLRFLLRHLLGLHCCRVLLAERQLQQAGHQQRRRGLQAADSHRHTAAAPPQLRRDRQHRSRGGVVWRGQHTRLQPCSCPPTCVMDTSSRMMPK
jgi:hypothetical protein